MAQDDRAVAEGSASWNLQGGLGLHLRGSSLQPGSHEESDHASDVSQRQAVPAGLEKDLLAAAAATKTLLVTKIAKPGQHS
jgi:hypothetical protein